LFLDNLIEGMADACAAIPLKMKEGSEPMKSSVVSKEYLELQQNINNLQEKWKTSLKPEVINAKMDQASQKAGVPILAFSSFHFNIALFLQWVSELSALLGQDNEGLADKLSGLKDILNEATALKWLEEALALNHVYFSEFAKDHKLDEWIPQFMAETALRPYLQLLAETFQSQIDRGVPGAGCPVCGEPVRLAQLEEEGKKVLHCPRCLAHWHANRLACSHCGNENHETIKFITIEEDPSSQIQICEECLGYTKIIDTRQYIEKPSAGMLDLKTIHLDFIAQENGYQAVGQKKQN
jgi:FdhE protein